MSTKLKDSTFDVSIKSGKAAVKRTFEFEGATISFDISVPVKDGDQVMSIADLHQRSVRQAIEHLQSLIPAAK